MSYETERSSLAWFRFRAFTGERPGVQVLSGDAYKSKRDEAQRLCRKADAWGDDEYVALALALDAAIWTYDNDFQRIPGLRIAGTTEVDEQESVIQRPEPLHPRRTTT